MTLPDTLVEGSPASIPGQEAAQKKVASCAPLESPTLPSAQALPWKTTGRSFFLGTPEALELVRGQLLVLAAMKITQGLPKIQMLGPAPDIPTGLEPRHQCFDF